MTSNYKEILSSLIKFAVVALAFWFVYHKLTTHDDLKDFIRLLGNTSTLEIWVVLGVIMFLMLMNWGVEAIKWKQLIKQVEQISLWRAVESVFSGLTWAVFTPNRIGEYGGRVFFLSPKRRIIGVVAMAVGNISQLVLTNVIGALAVCVFMYRFVPLDPIFMAAICGLAVVFALFFIIFYFNIKWINGLLLAMRFTRKYKRFYAVLDRYKKRELLKILLFSLARYAIFTSQYLIVFLWLIPSLAVLDILLLVPILFFVQSTLPSLDLLDIGIRSVTALFFFEYVTTQKTAVVACIASIWLINIVVPAILGSYLVFKLNIFGTSRSE